MLIKTDGFVKNSVLMFLKQELDESIM